MLLGSFAHTLEYVREGIVVRVVQAYRFALDPTGRQVAALASHCGAVRVAFNWGLARVKANLAQREAERSYGIPDDRLTPAAGSPPPRPAHPAGQ